MTTALVMAAIAITGFSFQLAMGRSTFAAPLLTHLHAVVFMGWVAIYVVQNALIASGSTAIHRRLGWLATGWVVAMVVLGAAVTVAMVRRGAVPFFFPPLQFLVFDPVVMVTFAGLTFAAVIKRRQTDWHRQLHLCAMALLLSAAAGRLLPMPLFIPFAFEASVVAVLILPAIGCLVDIRRRGSAHPAFLWGIGTIVGATAVIDAIAYGALGPPIYRTITAGTPGALLAPLAYPPPPSHPALAVPHRIASITP